MEDMRGKWTCKLPTGHARLLLTFTVIDRETGADIGYRDKKTTDILDSNPDNMRLSTEMRSFIDECVGDVYITNSTFEITFSNSEDYVRYRMTDFPERFPF